MGSVIAGVVVVALALTVKVHPEPLPGELAVVWWLQDLPEPVPTIAEVVRLGTGTEAAVAVAALAGSWSAWRRRTNVAAALAIAAVAMLVVQPALKEVVDRPRPTAGQVDVRADHTSESYPSGHSLGTTTVWGAAAGLAWRARRRPLAVACGVPVGLTAVASAVQGVHWPTDSFGGTLIGAIGARLIVGRLERRYAGDPGRRAGSPTARRFHRDDRWRDGTRPGV